MKIAVIGTGVMGSGLAEGLLKAGHQVIVYNRTQSKTEALVALGARAVVTAAEAFAQADASVIVLSDAAGVKAVLTDKANVDALKGRRLLNASTTKPAEIHELGGIVSAAGGVLSEVTLLVGADQLRSQEGQFLLGASDTEAVFWTGVLSGVGPTIHHVGKLGDASKAETPMLFASAMSNVMVAYSVAAAIKLNVPREVAEQQIRMVSPAADYLMPSLFSRNYDQVMASVESYAAVAESSLQTAAVAGLPTAILEDVLGIYRAAMERGLGKKDGTAILEVLLER